MLILQLNVKMLLYLQLLRWPQTPHLRKPLLLLMRKTIKYYKDLYKECYLEHYKIYKYIKKQDIKGARKAMVQHLSFLEKHVREEENEGRENLLFRLSFQPLSELLSSYKSIRCCSIPDPIYSMKRGNTPK